MCKSHLSSLVSHGALPHPSLQVQEGLVRARLGLNLLQTDWAAALHQCSLHQCSSYNDLDETTLMKTCSLEFMLETQAEGKDQTFPEAGVASLQNFCFL